MNRVFNFNPGPGLLPVEVLQKIQSALLSYGDTGMGILEISHRSKQFERLLNETKLLLAELLEIPTSHEILFVTGGATAQFSMVPMNLLREGKTGNYLVAGIWGDKAYEEAKKFGSAHIAASSKAHRYSEIPKKLILSPNPAYLHITSNNTVEGTQLHTFPGGAPLVCDASSDLLSRPMAVSNFELIYACAQKNIGPTGVTIVIGKRETFADSPSTLPILYSYKTYLDSNSLYNTPPVFAIYGVFEMLQWLKRNGGIQSQQERNRVKAETLYTALDSLPFYRSHAATDDRSLMNIVFSCPTPELDTTFAKEAEAHGLFGLLGHKAHGGIRASIYNAFPVEGVTALVQFMKDFAQKRG